MKVLLIVMALGGYNSNTPALLKIETKSQQECATAGQQIVDGLSEQTGAFLDPLPYTPGPHHIGYICVEQTALHQ
jgi:hypothetical protein